MFIIFFKPKSAYEMPISDWSSDVCSSDLHRAQHRHAEGNDSRRVGERDFLVEYMRLCGGPPWAAVFGRPMARQPTALMKNGMPLRSEERSGGKECVSTVRSWWSTDT